MKLLNLISIKNFVLVSIFLFSSSVFSQNTPDPANENSNAVILTADDNLMSKSEAAIETNFNFVSWFMGSKQSVNETASKEASTKKLLINSRVAPNRILMKTFLKKAQSQLSSIS